MVSISNIQELSNRIARQYQPQKIVLFGSYSEGTANPDSDVDLLVIMSFEGKGFWKSLEILNWLNPPFSVDLLVRRPDDTQRRYQQGDPLVRQAMDQGKVLYERGD
jgi:predicted nucleotidyltransferase